jgi:hypothetical protein
MFFLRFIRKLGFLARRERFNDDLTEEMAFHQEQTQKRLETVLAFVASGQIL